LRYIGVIAVVHAASAQGHLAKVVLPFGHVYNPSWLQITEDRERLIPNTAKTLYHYAFVYHIEQPPVMKMFQIGGVGLANQQADSR
jgi:hypothetical protein